MQLKKTDHLKIREKLINIKKNQNIIFEPLLIKYYQNYYDKSYFKDISFEIENKKNLILCPLTLETRDNQNYLSFFGNFFSIFYINKETEIFNYFFKTIQSIIEKEKIRNIKFSFQKQFSENDINLKYYKDIDKIVLNKNIDLTTDLQMIIKNFSKGHKSAIKKNYDELSYQIIDSENYNNEIFDMMNLHEQVSGKKTRSKKTWIINEEMIKEKKGILVKVEKENTAISYSFFFKNHSEALYFSSCTHRNFFKKYNNITHKSILHMIQHLKKLNCSKVTLGNTKTLYNVREFDLKENNIEKFKSSFGGKEFTNFYCKNISQKLLEII